MKGTFADDCLICLFRMSPIFMDTDSDQSGSRSSTPNTMSVVMDDRECSDAFVQEHNTLRKKIALKKGSKAVYEVSGRGTIHFINTCSLHVKKEFIHYLIISGHCYTIRETKLLWLPVIANICCNPDIYMYICMYICKTCIHACCYSVKVWYCMHLLLCVQILLMKLSEEAMAVGR